MEGRFVAADVIYRCVNDACGRSWPRQVAYCPYCGRRQVKEPLPVEEVAIVAPSAQPAAPTPAPTPVPIVAEAVKPPPRVKAKVNFGAKPLQIPELNPAMGDRRSAPTLRQPIRLRTWLMVLAGLVAIWYIAKPPGQRQKIDARIDADIALVGECKMAEARAELVALKSAKASESQLKRLQDAVAASAPACEKRRLRAKAWSEARGLIDIEMQYDHLDRAEAKLAAFNRKWGEGAESREWSDKIETKKGEHLLDQADACLTAGDRACLESKLAAVEKLKRPELAQRTLALRDSLSHLLETTLLGQASAPPVTAPAPVAVPRSKLLTTSPAVAQNDLMARRILADAEHELLQGNYKAAISKAQQCATMVETGNHECTVLKQRAERLDADMQRCLARGADWINERCQ